MINTGRVHVRSKEQMRRDVAEILYVIVSVDRRCFRY